jgi:hypothetical protein
MNICNDCGFTALFMYLDASGCPLCPRCSGAEIKAFKELTANLDDDLESELESIDNEEVEELNF